MDMDVTTPLTLKEDSNHNEVVRVAITMPNEAVAENVVSCANL